MLSWPHGNPKADAFAFHLVALLDALVAGVGIDHRLLAVKEISPVSLSTPMWTFMP
jgi:hypothetical protein